LISGGLLLLSTSRGSWAIVAVNVLILGVINRKQRKTLAALIVLLVVISALLLTSSRGEYIQQSFERTVSSERTLSSSTSGRSDQWWLFPEVLADSPLWGFGPGRGTAIYARYSNLYNIFHSGEGMAWHSLYLQVGIETGIIGMLALTMLVGPLLVRGIAHWRAAGNSVPLHGVVSFIVIALSVSGLDAASAVFLGLGFLSDNWHPPQAPVPAGSAALECCYSECSCAASFLVWERTVGRTTRKLS
jgi:O-antigen ligase